MAGLYSAIGLMSGTSLDGIDVACLSTDGHTAVAVGPEMSAAYDGIFRERLRGFVRGAPEAARIEDELTRLHATVVNELVKQNDVNNSNIDVIGFHGHTILHRPEQAETWQIGDGAVLAGLTGIDVVNDFRRADVAAGGQGAPLAPLYHAALAHSLDRPVAVLNLGGVANVTWVGPGPLDSGDGLVAFDTGPGIALIDDWVLRHTGQSMDLNGRLAAGGAVEAGAVEAMLDHPHCHRPPPKSLDRGDFSLAAVAGLSAVDGAATLTAVTAEAVARGARHFPAPVKRWLVTGGGRHNPVLMARLRERLGVPVEVAESVGWRGDAVEAEAFAFLAVRSLLGMPLSLPTTTGVPYPLTGGTLHRAPR